jgi:hypothetical protein
MFSLDPELPEDVADVLESAACLEISEFRVFELAYAAWFGRPEGEREARALDRHFFAYLYRDQVPPWVRALTREVVRSNRAGVLDLADYGIVHEPPTPTMIYLGIRYAVWAALTLVFIVAGAHMIAAPEGCTFPPCY